MPNIQDAYQELLKQSAENLLTNPPDGKSSDDPEVQEAYQGIQNFLNENPRVEDLRQVAVGQFPEETAAYLGLNHQAVEKLDPDNLSAEEIKALDEHALAWNEQVQSERAEREAAERTLLHDAYQHYLADQMGLANTVGSPNEYSFERYEVVNDLYALTTPEELRTYAMDNYNPDGLTMEELDAQITDWYLDTGHQLTVPGYEDEMKAYRTFQEDKELEEKLRQQHEREEIDAEDEEPEYLQNDQTEKLAEQKQAEQEQRERREKLDHAKMHYEAEHPGSLDNDAVYHDEQAVMDWYDGEVQRTRNAYLNAISDLPEATYSQLRRQEELMDSEDVWRSFRETYVNAPEREMAEREARREAERRRHEEEVERINKELLDNGTKHYKEEHPDIPADDPIYQDKDFLKTWYLNEVDKAGEAYLRSRGVSEQNMPQRFQALLDRYGNEGIWENFYDKYVKNPVQEKVEEKVEVNTEAKETPTHTAQEAPAQEAPETTSEAHSLADFMDEPEEEKGSYVLSDLIGEEEEPVFAPFEAVTPEAPEDREAAPIKEEPEKKEPLINASDPPAAGDKQEPMAIPVTYTQEKAEEPEVKVDEPEIKSDEPDIKSDEPEIKSDEPEIKSDEPEIKSDEPDIKSDEPDIKSDEPEIKSDEPEIKVDEPEIKSDEPEVKVDEPEMEQQAIEEQTEPEVKQPEVEEKLPELEKVEPRRRSNSFSAPRPHISPDTEKVKAPEVEVPKAPEAPKVEAPKVEAPKAPEAPKVEVPKAPQAGQPKGPRSPWQKVESPEFATRSGHQEPSASQPDRVFTREEIARYHKYMVELQDNLKETLSFFSSDSQQFKDTMTHLKDFASMNPKTISQEDLTRAFRNIQGDVAAYQQHNRDHPKPGNWRRTTRVDIMDKIAQLSDAFSHGVSDPKEELIKDATKAIANQIAETNKMPATAVKNLMQGLEQREGYTETMSRYSTYDLQKIAQGKTAKAIKAVQALPNKAKQPQPKQPAPEKQKTLSKNQVKLP